MRNKTQENTLENWLKNKIDEVEKMHDYEVSTETVRCWIEQHKNKTENIPIEIKILEEIERKYTFMIIEVYTFMKKVNPTLQDEEDLELYIINFEKVLKEYIKLKKYQYGKV